MDNICACSKKLKILLELRICVVELFHYPKNLHQSTWKIFMEWRNAGCYYSGGARIDNLRGNRQTRSELSWIFSTIFPYPFKFAPHFI